MGLEIGILLAWGLGALVALGVPGSIMARKLFLARQGWTRLPKTGTRVRGASPVTPEETESALRAFAQEYAKAFDVPVARFDALLSKLQIQWMPGDFFEIDYMGKPAKGRGLTASRTFIKVAARDQGLGHTALFHEMVHWTLWNLTGEPDPDHEKARYPGWTEAHTRLVKELKSRFKRIEAGIDAAPTSMGQALSDAAVAADSNELEVIDTVPTCIMCSRVDREDR
jgi:hypothetical protein